MNGFRKKDDGLSKPAPKPITEKRDPTPKPAEKPTPKPTPPPKTVPKK